MRRQIYFNKVVGMIISYPIFAMFKRTCISTTIPVQGERKQYLLIKKVSVFNFKYNSCFVPLKGFLLVSAIRTIINHNFVSLLQKLHDLMIQTVLMLIEYILNINFVILLKTCFISIFSFT